MATDARLDLYELGKREPIGYINWEGKVHFDRETHPAVCFADVPVTLHLSEHFGKGITLAPLLYSDQHTGPVVRTVISRG